MNHIKSLIGHKKHKSHALTGNISRYYEEEFPGHVSLKVKQLRKSVRNMVCDIGAEELGLIVFMGLPGVGKSSHTPQIQKAAESAIGFVKKEEYFHYTYSDGAVIEVGGYVCQKTNAILAMMHSDHFFRALGEDRTGSMLQNSRSCKRHWGDLRSAIQMAQDILSGKASEVRIYARTDEEKKSKKRQGKIQMKHHNIVPEKKIIIVEGVDTGEWLDRIKEIQEKIKKKTQKVRMKTMKILFDMSMEDSLVRVLRRDHDKSNKTFESILHHRLQEYYYILQNYIIPALQDPDAILLQKSREVPMFLESERIEILIALEKFRLEFEAREFPEPGQKEFILKFTREMHQIFDTMHGVGPIEMGLWRKQKKLKKVRREYKKGKRANTEDVSDRKKQAQEVKKLKKELKSLKKKIMQTSSAQKDKEEES